MLRSAKLNRNDSRFDRLLPWKGVKLESDPVLEFDPQITWIIGENGSGKSTLIKAMGEYKRGGLFSDVDAGEDGVKSLYIDLEKHNPRMMDTNVAKGNDEFMALVATHFASHGQANKSLIYSGFEKVRKENSFYLIIMDEPENALSPWAQLAMLEDIKKLFIDQVPIQIVCATHSIFYIQSKIGGVIDLNEKDIRLVPAANYELKLG